MFHQRLEKCFAPYPMSRREFKRWKDYKRLEAKREISNRGSSDCSYCGGEMSWCSICDRWTSDCCEIYGTCMCS